VSVNGKGDLKSFGLLKNNTNAFRPQVPLGYAAGALPSFVVPPEEVGDLIFLHGSCRKVHGGDRDALAYVDSIIEDTKGTAKRPHQLFLTGDQIYADDIPSALLLELTTFATNILGMSEAVHIGNVLTEVTAQNFPPGRRQKLIKETAQFSSTDAASHLISFGEFCAMYLFAWSNAVWPDALQDKHVVLNREEPQPPTDLNLLLSPLDSKSFEGAEGHFDEQAAAISEYRRRLPQVRRALANIPVSMIFDDHEITDDWNFSSEWQDRTLASTNLLARAIIRNGLAAYAIFQGWGNDPTYFETVGGKGLLDDVEFLFDGVAGPSHVASIDARFGFGSTGKSTVSWHYNIERAKYRFIVLDTRTQRALAKERPPGLLSAEALTAQVPASLLPLDATIIVSAAPVIGQPVMESIFPVRSRLMNRYGYWHLLHRFPHLHSLPDNNEFGALANDLEAWGLDLPAFERFLSRLYDLETVVLLGGDVHYGFSMSMTYWRGSGETPRRFAQLTSSALKNPSPAGFDLLKSVIGTWVFRTFDDAPAMLGWSSAVTLTPPPSMLWGKDLRARLSQLPVMLLEDSCESGTTPDRPREWAWRAQVEIDERADDGVSGRPQSATLQFPQPDISFLTLPAAEKIHIYLPVLEQAAKNFWNLPPRVVSWYASVGRVSFEKPTSGELHVVHDIMCAHPNAAQLGEPEPWIRHSIRIGADPGAKEPQLTE
jgi:hypothetical protein